MWVQEQRQDADGHRQKAAREVPRLQGRCAFKGGCPRVPTTVHRRTCFLCVLADVPADVSVAISTDVSVATSADVSVATSADVSVNLCAGFSLVRHLWNQRGSGPRGYACTRIAFRPAGVQAVAISSLDVGWGSGCRLGRK